MFNKKFINKIKLDCRWTKRPTCRQSGMTYVELIVVLSIFAMMSSVVMFNYGSFQKKIDIKNLASDVGLKIMEAQKYSVSGKLPPEGTRIAIETLWNPAGGINAWRPSYGVYFNTAVTTKSFTYFADTNFVATGSPLNQNGFYDISGVDGFLETVNFNKNYYISAISITGPEASCPANISELTIVFKRPNSGAKITNNTDLTSSCTVEKAEITVSSSGSD